MQIKLVYPRHLLLKCLSQANKVNTPVVVRQGCRLCFFLSILLLDVGTIPTVQYFLFSHFISISILQDFSIKIAATLINKLISNENSFQKDVCSARNCYIIDIIYKKKLHITCAMCILMHINQNKYGDEVTNLSVIVRDISEESENHSTILLSKFDDNIDKNNLNTIL